jgi:hypothetical protein
MLLILTCHDSPFWYHSFCLSWLVPMHQDETTQFVRRLPQLSCSCADHSQLSRTLSTIMWGSSVLYGTRLTFKHLMYFMIPNGVIFYSKRTFMLSTHSKVTLYYCWDFIGSENKTDIVHCTWILTFVTVLSIPTNHRHRDSTADTAAPEYLLHKHCLKAHL